MKRLICALVLLLTPITADAQIYAEIRGGGAIGSLLSTRAGLEIVPDITFDVLVRYEVTDMFTVYGGVGRLAFGCDDGFCNGIRPVISSNHARIGAAIGWRMLWMRAGGLAGVMQVNGPGVRTTSDTGFGMYGSTGIRFSVYGGIECLPGVRISRMQVGESWATALSADIGLGYSLSF